MIVLNTLNISNYKLTERYYSCNKIKLRPEFKFPAKIEMAFSQILAINSF